MLLITKPKTSSVPLIAGSCAIKAMGDKTRSIAPRMNKRVANRVFIVIFLRVMCCKHFSAFVYTLQGAM